MLIPMYFLIGMWGGPKRQYATIKFVLYTLAGSLLMLVSIVWLYVASSSGGQVGTFDLVKLTDPQGPIATSTMLGENVRLWLFLGFAAAFAIKVPIFPLHTWQADAYEQSPTAATFMLAAVLPKVGAYGFARFCIPLFPDVALKVAPWFIALAVVGIIYGALVAYTQTDLKRLLAYSSLSHLGFCILGLFAFTREGVNGSVLQMVNHGLSTGALFLIVGMLVERRQTREISQYGGLWKVLPIFAFFFLVSILSSIGLPLLNGFVGEFLILLGTWGAAGSQHFSQWATGLAATGVILGAIYMLWMFQRVMQGPLDNDENRKLKDLGLREALTLAPLVLLMFWIGVMPNPTLRLFDQAVNKTVVQPISLARARAEAARQGAARPATPAVIAELPHSKKGLLEQMTERPTPGAGAETR
jgi:NADH-quinone oxidoreductase subunit M